MIHTDGRRTIANARPHCPPSFADETRALIRRHAALGVRTDGFEATLAEIRALPERRRDR